MDRVKVLALKDGYKVELEKELLESTYNQTYAYDQECIVEYEGPGTLNKEIEFLLKRAFSDFEKINLKSLTLGNSALGAFCIHVASHNIDVERPTPFFAKCDVRKKIIRELENYKNHVSPAIPFNLRPNVDERRSITGAKYGLLVGNFVENSERLWTAIKSGHAKPIIQSLFENTLYAWRHPLHPVSSNSPLFSMTPLKDVDLSHLKARYFEAKKMDDSVLEPEELYGALSELPYVDFVKIRIHGDLHTENICCRSGEAILIDFASVDYGPPAMDPAFLEVSIAFRRWPGEFTDLNVWKKTIDQIYTFSAGIMIPTINIDPYQSGRVWDSISQIRNFAFSHTDNDQIEYLGCLAYWLFKVAKYPPLDEHDQDVLAYAYLKASTIVESLITQ